LNNLISLYFKLKPLLLHRRNASNVEIKFKSVSRENKKENSLLLNLHERTNHTFHVKFFVSSFAVYATTTTTLTSTTSTHYKQTTTTTMTMMMFESWKCTRIFFFLLFHPLPFSLPFSSRITKKFSAHITEIGSLGHIIQTLEGINPLVNCTYFFIYISSDGIVIFSLFSLLLYCALKP
jgi:hypothetical protein